MRERDFMIIAGLMTIASAALIFWFKYPALLDYPNHLARMHILANPSDPYLAEFYSIQFQVPTNLAMEFFIPLFDLVLPLSIAGKVFIALTIGLIVFAPIFVSKMLIDEVHFLTLLPSLFLFNAAFMYGFLNFLFSAVAALYCFAVYVRLDRNDFKFTAVLGCLFPIILFLLHVYGFIVYAACIGSFYLAKIGLRDFKALAVRGIQFVPVLFLLAVFVVQSTASDGTPLNPTRATTDLALMAIDIEGVEAVDLQSTGSWVPYRVTVLWDRVASLWGQYEGLQVLVVLLLMGVASLFIWKRKWPAAPELIAPILVLIGLVLFMPDSLFGAGHVNWRFMIPAALLAGAVSAGVSFSKQAQRLITGAICALFSAQLLITANKLGVSDAYQDKILATLSALPAGSSVFPVFPSGGSLEAQEPIPRTHMPTLGVIENSLFIPTLFAFSTQQPLTFNEGYRGYPHRVYYKNFEGIDWRPIGQSFDYILILDHDGATGGRAVDWARRIPLNTEIVRADGDEIALLAVADAAHGATN